MLRDGKMGVGHVRAEDRSFRTCVCYEFSLKTDDKRWRRKSDGTHIEDVKDPVKIQLPGSNRFFVILRTEKARNRVSLALFDCLPLNLRRGPGMKISDLSCTLAI